MRRGIQNEARRKKWGVRRVTAARRTAGNWGEWEYRVKWEDGGVEAWEGRDHMGVDTEEMARARENALPASSGIREKMPRHGFISRHMTGDPEV